MWNLPRENDFTYNVFINLMNRESISSDFQFFKNVSVFSLNRTIEAVFCFLMEPKILYAIEINNSPSFVVCGVTIYKVDFSIRKSDNKFTIFSERFL